MYGQIGVGIWMDNSTVQQNVVYSNAIGIRVGDQGYSPGGKIANNVIYANSQQGVLVGGGSPQIVNNTIYQPLGDAIRVQEGTVGLDVRDNILWVQAGYDLFIDPSSQVGFKSDYNILYTTAAGRIGSWQGTDRATLTAWRNASFTDENSLAVDPLFVDPAGPDHLLGFSDLGARRPRRRFSFAEHRRQFSRWFVRAGGGFKHPAAGAADGDPDD